MHRSLTGPQTGRAKRFTEILFENDTQEMTLVIMTGENVLTVSFDYVLVGQG